MHQHYLQILLEDGVVGLELFAGALAAMPLALWKKRKQIQESEYYWLYPALYMEFVMNSGMIVFPCMTYALYRLIIGMCAEPFAGIRKEKEGAGEKA